MSGRFVWFELVTSDVEGGIRFWSEVAGFGREDMNMGTFAYPMLTAAGRTVAGVVPPQMPGVPNHWLGYWGVDDVDARTDKAASLGGKVLVPPTDIPTVGRFSLIADPQGAWVALFKGADPSSTPADTFHWMELWTRDAAAAATFYAAVLGLGTRDMDMPTGRYTVLEAGGVPVAGVMASSKPEVPPMWLPYLAVPNVDEAVSRVRSHGGAVHADAMEVAGVGRFAITADRQGAVLGVITPAGDPAR